MPDARRQGENNVRPHCPMQPPAIHLPTSQPHLGPALLATGTPSSPDIDLWIVPLTALSTRLKGKRKGGKLTKLTEQVDGPPSNKWSRFTT